jgi:arylsulfatase A-like enzyme
MGLSLDERLLPEFLKAQGYVTKIIGKWHLGRGKNLEYMPTRRGFDSFFGHPGGAMDYWKHTDQSGEEVLYRDLSKVREDGYATDLFGDDAVKFVREHKDRPFFLYLPFNAPHTPLQTPEKPFEPLDQLMKPRSIPDARARFACMVERMDKKIGDLLVALDEAGLSDNTIVVFMSDNGGPEYSGRNLPLNGHKVALLEGGHRVPFIARWPGRIAPGTKYDGLCAGMDLFTTFISLSGGRDPDDRKIDGVNLIPYLTGKTSKNAHDWLAWESHNEKWLRRGYRKGPWKLRYMRAVDSNVEHNRLGLYNVGEDISESMNLAESRPDKLQELVNDLARWERDVGVESILEVSREEDVQ